MEHFQIKRNLVMFLSNSDIFIAVWHLLNIKREKNEKITSAHKFRMETVI
jgi:hypothetical protein